ncbi:gamma-tubulin complex component 2 [Cryptosporidium felis]|nr:gamma-tubulin complex component 2 [Cryptosporidium felis]
MDDSSPSFARFIKYEGNNYLFYGVKTCIRVCNHNCEYLTVFRDVASHGYTLGFSNLQQFGIRSGRSTLEHGFSQYSSMISSSEFYLLNLAQLFGDFSDKTHIQYGDRVYLYSLVDNQALIIGFDHFSNKFLVSRFEEILDLKKEQTNTISFSNYEWFFEKVNISIDELTFEGISQSQTPNIQSVKYNDPFIIKCHNGNIIYPNNIHTESTLYINKLEIGDSLSSGRNGYWAAIALESGNSLYPDWFLKKQIMNNKKNFLCLGSRDKYIGFEVFKELISKRYDFNIKDCVGRVQFRTLNLVSNPPVGWNNLYTGLEDKLKIFSKSDSTFPFYPSLFGFVFDHAASTSEEPNRDTKLTSLNSLSLQVQEQLIIEDILNCMCCIDGNYIHMNERMNIVDTGEMHGIISETLFITEFNSSLQQDTNGSFCIPGKEGLSFFSFSINYDTERKLPTGVGTESKSILEQFKEYNGEPVESSDINLFNDGSDPFLYSLTHKILELSSLHYRVRQFLKIHESGCSNLGIISETLCDTIRQLLKHFTLKIIKLEQRLRRGELSIQNLWGHFQKALSTFKILDSISTRTLYKRGCKIIDELFDISGDPQHEDATNSISSFVFYHLLVAWIRSFLVPWLKYGDVDDHYSEFDDCESENMDENWGSLNLNLNRMTKVNKRYVFPLFLQEVKIQMDFIGFASYTINIINKYHINKFCNVKNYSEMYQENIESDLEEIIQSLDYNLGIIKIERLKNYINVLHHKSQLSLYNAYNSVINIRHQMTVLKEIFFCINDSLIQELIEYVGMVTLEYNGSGVCSYKKVSSKWSELITKYYSTHLDCNINQFFCAIERELLTELNVTLIPVKLETNSFAPNIEYRGTSSRNEKFPLNSELFKYLTIKLCVNEFLSNIWPKELLNKYQFIFRFVFQIKYVNSLLANSWKVQQSTPIWEYRARSEPTVKANELMGKSYSLRQKMLLLTTSFLEYIYYEVINPLYNSFANNFEKNMTVGKFVSIQDEMLDEILTRCFFMENEMLCSICNILSLCHLFVRHSAFLDVYGLPSLTKSGSNSQDIQDSRPKRKSGGSDGSVRERRLLRRKGRYCYNRSLVSSLLNDRTYNIIVDKFDSKFQILLCKFICTAINCKSIKFSLLERLIMKINYNHYYSDKIPSNLKTKVIAALDSEAPLSDYFESE